jgi:hypothetical protein
MRVGMPRRVMRDEHSGVRAGQSLDCAGTQSLRRESAVVTEARSDSARKGVLPRLRVELKAVGLRHFVHYAHKHTQVEVPVQCIDSVASCVSVLSGIYRVQCTDQRSTILVCPSKYVRVGPRPDYEVGAGRRFTYS